MQPIHNVGSVRLEAYFSEMNKKPGSLLKNLLKPKEGKKSPGIERSTTISWASDIHFDCSNEQKINEFFNEVIQQNPSILLLAGDIDLSKKNPTEPFGGKILAEGIISTVKKIQQAINCKIYFVCGNHDFYFSAIDEVRSQAKENSLLNPNLQYVHETEGIELDLGTVLVGHDGWADSRSGDFWNSKLILNDFFYIKDFPVKTTKDIFTTQVKLMLEEMGDQSARYANKILPDLLKKYKKVIFLTHVPPFREASWHEGKISEEGAAPFFVNQALGESLKKIMAKHPKNQMLVLCGHTHSGSIYQPLKNLTVLTAGAEYGSPVPQQSIVLD